MKCFFSFKRLVVTLTSHVEMMCVSSVEQPGDRGPDCDVSGLMDHLGCLLILISKLSVSFRTEEPL